MTYTVQFRHLGALKFNQGDIEILRTYAVPHWGWINLILSSLLMALPLTREEIPDTPFTLMRVLLIFLITVVLCYVASRSMGSPTKFSNFLYTTATVNLFATFVVALLTYVSLFVFEWIMNNSVLSNTVASILPFYIFVLFGFSVDGASALPEKKGALLGVIGITVLYVLYFRFA